MCICLLKYHKESTRLTWIEPFFFLNKYKKKPIYFFLKKLFPKKLFSKELFSKKIIF